MISQCQDTSKPTGRLCINVMCSTFTKYYHLNKTICKSYHLQNIILRHNKINDMFYLFRLTDAFFVRRALVYEKLSD